MSRGYRRAYILMHVLHIGERADLKSDPYRACLKKGWSALKLVKTGFVGAIFRPNLANELEFWSKLAVSMT